MIRKQSDLGLCFLSGPLWQATSVRNFRTSTVVNVFGMLVPMCGKFIIIANTLVNKMQF